MKVLQLQTTLNSNLAAATEWKETEHAGEAEVALQTAILDVTAVGVPHLHDDLLRRFQHCVWTESELQITETQSRDARL